MQETIDKLNKSFSEFVEVAVNTGFTFEMKVHTFFDVMFEGFMKSKGYKEAVFDNSNGCFKYNEATGFILYTKSETIADGVLKYLHNFDLFRNAILKYFNKFYIGETK